MCSTGRCGTVPIVPYGDSSYNTYSSLGYSYPLGDFVLVYKLPQSVPKRLKDRNLDLAYDPCYKPYRLVKRMVTEEPSTVQYTEIDGTVYKCTCKTNCKGTTCFCVKCRDLDRVCRVKKYFIKKSDSDYECEKAYICKKECSDSKRYCSDSKRYCECRKECNCKREYRRECKREYDYSR